MLFCSPIYKILRNRVGQDRIDTLSSPENDADMPAIATFITENIEDIRAAVNNMLYTYKNEKIKENENSARMMSNGIAAYCLFDTQKL
jgi:hypothetical protein